MYVEMSRNSFICYKQNILFLRFDIELFQKSRRYSKNFMQLCSYIVK